LDDNVLLQKVVTDNKFKNHTNDIFYFFGVKIF